VYLKVSEEVIAGRGLSIERMVELGRVSRASFSRFNTNPEIGPDKDMNLRDSIQRIALEWPSFGRPRITAELRQRRWTVNPKRVYRLLREDNLLCVSKRKFVVITNSNHGRKVYPNQAAAMVLTGVNQLWRADITSSQNHELCRNSNASRSPHVAASARKESRRATPALKLGGSWKSTRPIRPSATTGASGCANSATVSEQSLSRRM